MNSLELNLKRFPETSPFSEKIKDDINFDPKVHLSLEKPTQVFELSDFGYPDEILETTPTKVAATSCFRILSDEGVEAMHHVCKQLESYTTSNPRISRNTRGGVYRSDFLRDFSLSTDVTEHLSEIMQTNLLPHAMGHHLSHLNYQPLEIGENVDKWHYDTLQADYVMFVTDPNKVEGGEFQYFNGTRDEMAELHKAKQTVPTDRIIAPEMPGAGYAVLMQGNYVVHQAKAVRSEGDRITLVNGYTYADVSIDDFTAFKQLLYADPESCVVAEYTRHMALRSVDQLASCINQSDFSTNRATSIERLESAREELEEAIAVLKNDENEQMKHFGD